MLAGLCGAWLVGVATSAEALLIQPVSQDRRVSTSVSVDDGILSDSDSDSLSAPDFGPFDETAQASASIPGRTATATAFQRSTIGSDTVSADGAVSAFTTDGFDDATARSFFEITFDITQRLPFELIASVTNFVDDESNSSVDVLLRGGPGDQVIGQTRVDSSLSDNFLFASGVLEPGSYVLRASASLVPPATGGDTWSGDYSLSFSVVPEPSSFLLLGSGLLLVARRGRATSR